ncbi:hypothetical protein [Planctopirus hydrillae]|uniref:Uncharacterized protein n=1 Tax=Planctopirus hydrillae TaxID=1841610 RepID=A0A1C3ENP1_9PLAN|nr:hypothetical protein [Planctopirus hydrillae]ODA34873.1 hypothetical protein A6X21_04280 [Planctopirus hydrillae]
MPLMWDVAPSAAVSADSLPELPSSAGPQVSSVDLSFVRAAHPPAVDVLGPALNAAIRLWNCPAPWFVTGAPEALQKTFLAQGDSPPHHLSLAWSQHDWWVIPPVTEQALEQLASRLSFEADPPKVNQSTKTCLSGRPAVVIDHYSQALLLQSVWSTTNFNTPLTVALSIRLVDRGEGVRIGHDLKDLLLGVGRMPGLKIEAIWGDFSWLSESEVPGGLSLMQLAARQLADVANINLPPICHELPQKFWPLVDCVESAPTIPQSLFSYSFPSWWNMLQKTSAVPLALLQGAVISRPTIQTAVLNLGSKHFHDIGWGELTKISACPSLRLLQDAGAKCQRLLAEKSLWELSPEAGDLRIGHAATCIPISGAFSSLG